MTVTKILLPSNNPHFSTKITLADIVYTFEFRWNQVAERWALSVYNDNDEPLFQGCFASTGVNYTKMFKGFPEDTYFIFLGDEKSYEGLGTTFNLFTVQ